MEGLIGHEHIVRFFTEAFARGNCTHAYLLSGPLSVGKTTLLCHLARQILCVRRTGDDTCASCVAHEKSLHPDFSLLDQSEEDAGDIRIDAVRDIERRAQLQPVLSALKIFVLVHADRLTKEAANALLKIFEDPPARTVFFVSAEFPRRLPATLRSRLQHLSCPPISTQSIVALLRKKGEDEDRAVALAALSGGCPGIALRAREDDTAREAHARQFDTWLKLFLHPETVFQLDETIELAERTRASFLATGQLLAHDLLRMHCGRPARVLGAVADVAIQKQLLARYPLTRLRSVGRAFFETIAFLHTNASPKLIIENLLLSF